MLGLLFAAKERPERLDELIEMLLNTNGVLQGFDKWDQVLSK